MKLNRLFLIFFFVILFTTPCFGENKTDTEWFPFVIGEKLDPNSPANIGKLVLDPPAGKHGFVKVKDGHFYFEDGTRAKFWGTNLCFNACFPSKEQAEIMANRLAFFGFNAVRLHHMDFYFDPRGIFEDTNPQSDDPQLKTTLKLSKRQLDCLDYLIYQLKKRGIYIDMNLLVSRCFTKADGVIDADKLGRAAKPVSMFDSKLIELQKKYAQDLLTHYNPYTKLRYCNDSAIALVEITNENSIVDSWYSDRLNGDFGGLKTSAISDYYAHELDAKWSGWLKQKYGTGVNVPRPIFKFASIYPKRNIEDASAFYTDLQRVYFDSMIGFLKQKVGIRVPIGGMGGYYNKNDLISMRSCDFIDTHTYWDHPSFNAPWSWDKYAFRINNKSVLLDKKLGLVGDIMEHFPSSYMKPYTITEWNHCYPNQYAYETPVLLASYAANNNWDALFQFAFADGWKENPVFDNIQGYFDLIANSQQLILCSLGSFVYHNAENLNLSIKDGTYAISSPKLIGISGFIKNKLFMFENTVINSNCDGAVFIYSPSNRPIVNSDKLVLIAISDIKNKDSYWKDEKFEWGTFPVLLRKVDVKIKLNYKYKIFELTPQGRLGKEIENRIDDNTAILFGENTAWFEIIRE